MFFQVDQDLPTRAADFELYYDIWSEGSQSLPVVVENDPSDHYERRDLPPGIRA